MKVFGSNIIVEPTGKESFFDERKSHYKGKILFMGDCTVDVQIGDIVYFNTFNSVFIPENKYYVVPEINILAKP